MKTSTKKKYGSSFTPEQKEEYKIQKEAEKQRLYELYQRFLEKKTIKELIGIVASYKTMYKYTLRNICLVLAQAEQRQDDKFVGVLNSFLNWKKQEIQILKGSKGYKVLVPIFTKVRSLESDSQNSTTESEGSEKVLTYFKLGNVFDISQTTEYENYLKEQQEIDKVIMRNAEIEYQIAFDFVKNNFPKVVIKEDFKRQESKGTYSPVLKEITLCERSSHTIFHELGHHITITVLSLDTNDYAKNEVLAELTAYLLMTQFDENLQYNFTYSNIWSNRITDSFKLEEFEQCFKKITTYINNLSINGGV